MLVDAVTRDLLGQVDSTPPWERDVPAWLESDPEKMVESLESGIVSL
jgi:hypothetical protein